MKCLTAQQQPDEQLSAFVLRLKVLLQKAIPEGAVEKTSTDDIHLRQVLTRANLTETLDEALRRLRMIGRSPTFLALLGLIQESKTREARLASNMGAQVLDEVGHLVPAQVDGRANAKAEDENVEKEEDGAKE